MLKELELPEVFHGKVLKDSERGKVAEYVISSWTFF